tara:strand:+ start:459 stop:791 length:333 start_codon:yes stop_codon:yes gene_type:complete
MKTRFSSEGGLQASNQTLVSCKAGQRIQINSMYMCNPHSSTIAIEVYHVPDGADPGLGHALYDTTLAIGGTTTTDAVIYMNPGDRIVAIAATADHVIITIYAEVTETRSE